MSFVIPACGVSYEPVEEGGGFLGSIRARSAKANSSPNSANDIRECRNRRIRSRICGRRDRSDAARLRESASTQPWPGVFGQPAAARADEGWWADHARHPTAETLRAVAIRAARRRNTAHRAAPTGCRTCSAERRYASSCSARVSAWRVHQSTVKSASSGACVSRA